MVLLGKRKGEGSDCCEKRGNLRGEEEGRRELLERGNLRGKRKVKGSD